MPTTSEALITLEDIHAARERIAGTAVVTGLYKLDTQRMIAAGFNVPTTAEIWLKAENEQPIGSFKLRGAYNKIASLSPDELERGVITYSSGNHAQGVAFAGRALGAKAVIVMPESAPRIKREATIALGGDVVLVGPASLERKQKAEELVAEHGYVMVPPYDDDFIIAGQATCGLEITEQAPDADLVLSPVSGGGLLSGVAAAVKLSGAKAQVWGCEPELAADAQESFRTRTLVEWKGTQTTRTIADGLRTQSLGERNFHHILKFVDGIITVTEEEILEATRVLLLATDIVPEPSGAVTLAAALFHADKLPTTKKVVVVVSGGNIDPTLREELLTAEA
ncbi:threonine ammonia-lyase [Terriglobus roseus]|uniref:Threonine dehydratase n=1 Tax=Terriglobus roseus TaxID=392734 RepID=A0A1H4RY14_9BACT|nr:threonine/serine dehydratase [Terriglobus roseus]SEC36805.1 threonine dehydratase [Terriglobus roseus]